MTSIKHHQSQKKQQELKLQEPLPGRNPADFTGTTPLQSAVVTPLPERKGPVDEVDELDDLEDEAEEPDEYVEPPPQLSPNAIRKRLGRILTPKANGDFKIPKQVIDDFGGDNKDKLFLMFEKAGYDRVRGYESKSMFENLEVDSV